MKKLFWKMIWRSHSTCPLGKAMKLECPFLLCLTYPNYNDWTRLFCHPLWRSMNKRRLEIDCMLASVAWDCRGHGFSCAMDQPLWLGRRTGRRGRCWQLNCPPKSIRPTVCHEYPTNHCRLSEQSPASYHSLFKFALCHQSNYALFLTSTVSSYTADII